MIDYINEEIKDDEFKINSELLARTESFLNTNYKDQLEWSKIEKSMEILDKIKDISDKIKKDFDLILLCGIGGSYLGSRAVIEALKGQYVNLNQKPKILYIGNSLSVKYISDVLNIVKASNPCILVISKSGNTTEPLISFQLIKNYFKEKYKDYKDRIYMITDTGPGRLNKYIEEENYKHLSVDKNMVGRYSLLSAVGILPMAIMGIDVYSLLKGAKDYKDHILSLKPEDRSPLRYALSRKLSFDRDKNVEILSSTNPNFEFLLKWYVQLFSESEGKKKKVILPYYLIYSQDLHSMGQFLQDGPNNIFETSIVVRQYDQDININLEEVDYKCFKGKKSVSLDLINERVHQATSKAHSENNINTANIFMDKLDEYNMGQLLYFFMYACSISAILFEANPYNQPGVEKYKAIYKDLM